MESIQIFHEIKKLTHGYLDEIVYNLIYQEALNVKNGIAIDIGPAQGASTISIALAAKMSKRIKRIYSIDNFCNSAALSSYSDINENINVLVNNLKKYDVENLVKICIAKDNNKLPLNDKAPITLLFIDADGAIDRDFAVYYNKIIDKGTIIIDDCENIFNLQATTRFLKWQTDYQRECFLKSIGLSQLIYYTPLGKQYTTYRFIEYLSNNNFIEINNIYNGTLFAKKGDCSLKIDNKAINDMNEIRKDILDQYTRLNTKIIHCYSKLNETIFKITTMLNATSSIFFEFYFYGVKERWQSVKTYEFQCSNENYIKDDLDIQDISNEEIQDIIDNLVSYKITDMKTEIIRSIKIKNFFEKLLIYKIYITPVHRKGHKQGFFLFYNIDKPIVIKDEDNNAISNKIKNLEKILENIHKDIDEIL